MPALFVEDALFFPLNTFSVFVKNQVFVGVWINIQIFDLIPLVNLSVFMPVPGCFHYCSSIIELNVRDGDASGCSFISWLSCVFVFPYEVQYYSFKVCEELCWDFDGIAMNL